MPLYLPCPYTFRTSPYRTTPLPHPFDTSRHPLRVLFEFSLPRTTRCLRCLRQPDCALRTLAPFSVTTAVPSKPAGTFANRSTVYAETWSRCAHPSPPRPPLGSHCDSKHIEYNFQSHPCQHVREPAHTPTHPPTFPTPPTVCRGLLFSCLASRPSSSSLQVSKNSK